MKLHLFSGIAVLLEDGFYKLFSYSAIPKKSYNEKMIGIKAEQKHKEAIIAILMETKPTSLPMPDGDEVLIMVVVDNPEKWISEKDGPKDFKELLEKI